jgi:hypothetical protein
LSGAVPNIVAASSTSAMYSLTIARSVRLTFE